MSCDPKLRELETELAGYNVQVVCNNSFLELERMPGNGAHCHSEHVNMKFRLFQVQEAIKKGKAFKDCDFMGFKEDYPKEYVALMEAIAYVRKRRGQAYSQSNPSLTA